MDFLNDIPTDALQHRLIEIDFDLRNGVTDEASIWLFFEINAIQEEIRCRQYDTQTDF